MQFGLHEGISSKQEALGGQESISILLMTDEGVQFGLHEGISSKQEALGGQESISILLMTDEDKDVSEETSELMPYLPSAGP